MDFINNPQFTILMTVLISSLVTAVPVFFLRWKLRAEVETVRLNAELAEGQRIENARLAEERRLETVRLEMERLKTEQLVAQQVIKEALERKALEDREGMTAQNKSLSEIHGLVNSQKTALELVESNLRSELKATETAASVAALAASKELQTTKELAARDLLAKDLQIAALMQELKGIVREPVVSSPVKAHDVAEAAKMDPNGDMVVVIPETIVPVEAAKDKPLIVKP